MISRRILRRQRKRPTNQTSSSSRKYPRHMSVLGQTPLCLRIQRPIICRMPQRPRLPRRLQQNQNRKMILKRCRDGLLRSRSGSDDRSMGRRIEGEEERKRIVVISGFALLLFKGSVICVTTGAYDLYDLNGSSSSSLSLAGCFTVNHWRRLSIGLSVNIKRSHDHQEQVSITAGTQLGKVLTPTIMTTCQLQYIHLDPCLCMCRGQYMPSGVNHFALCAYTKTSREHMESDPQP